VQVCPEHAGEAHADERQHDVSEDLLARAPLTNSSENWTASRDTMPTMMTACVGVWNLGLMYDRNRGTRPLPFRPMT